MMQSYHYLIITTLLWCSPRGIDSQIGIDAPFTASTKTKWIDKLGNVKLQLSLKAESQSSIRLSWKPVSPANAIRGYHIYWTKSGSTAYQRVTLDTSRSTYMLGNLQSDTEYEVSMEAFDDLRLSPISKRKTVRTLPEVPSTPSTRTKGTESLQDVKLQLSLQAKSPSTVLLSWKLVSPATPIKGYQIYLRKSGSTYYKMITLDNSRTSYMLRNLQADTEYEVSMKVFNAFYQSPITNIETIRTLPEVPSTASTLTRRIHNLQNVKLQLSLQAESPSSILLSWKPVRPANAIRGYHIYWTKSGSTAYQKVTLDNSRSTYMLRDLQANTEYEVSMEAFNDLYLSPISKWKTVRTLREVPNTASTPVKKIYNLQDVKLQLSLQAQSPSSILLSWKPVRSGLQVKGYYIYFRKSGSRNYQRVTLDNSRSTYLLGNLQAETEYEVSMEAYNHLYLSPISKKETVRTLLEVPITPSTTAKKNENLQNVRLQLSLQAQSQSSILLSWKPVSPGIQIKGYNIYVRKVGSRDYQRVTLDNSRTFYKLGNLQAATEYEVSMNAFNGLNLSPISNRETAKTLPGDEP